MKRSSTISDNASIEGADEFQTELHLQILRALLHVGAVEPDFFAITAGSRTANPF